MLTIFGNRARFCDGISRRNFLRIGAVGLAGLTLPDILRAEAASGIRKSAKSLILIYLPGGPSHQDMFDLKPDAPSEIRGEFKPIKTNVPGIEICEHFPLLAQMMDKVVPIRSVVGSEGQHGAFQCLTGRMKKGMPPGGWPSIGAVISKLQGPAAAGIPPYVSLSGQDGARNGDSTPYGYLGVAHAPFSPSGQGRKDMTLNGVTLDRLTDRKTLLQSLDRFRRDVDASGAMDGMDSFNRQAMEVLTSNKLGAALDMKGEDPKSMERYKGKGGGRSLDSFLVARRLVEAGARCVTLAFGGWDTHGNNFKTLKEQLPQLDRGLASLIGDIYDRGMEKDVTVMMWGEFGRTPKVNDKAGRDHWPKVCGALMAGGGMKTGQVIGKTDRLAGEVADRPVTFSEVFATLYYNLGIDTSKMTLPDLSGRPQYLTDGAQAIRELA